VRERKSVERLVALIDKDSSKEFRVEKVCQNFPELSRTLLLDMFIIILWILQGRGAYLKDIPNGMFIFYLSVLQASISNYPCAEKSFVLAFQVYSLSPLLSSSVRSLNVLLLREFYVLDTTSC
jgi:hypothetical protein